MKLPIPTQVRNWINEDGESGQQTHYFHCYQIVIPREMIDKDGNLLWFGNYTGWNYLKKMSGFTRTCTSRSDCKTNMSTVRRGCITTSSGTTILMQVGLWIRIRLDGGDNFYFYPPNIYKWIDILGLNKCNDERCAKILWKT